eukprot:scaffold54765_cov31-Tisochrysis_lutea.AAC.4
MAFGSMGGKFANAMKTGCSTMVTGMKSILPKCREEAHKLSNEAASRDINVMEEPLKKPASAMPSKTYIQSRRAESGYTL